MPSIDPTHHDTRPGSTTSHKAADKVLSADQQNRGDALLDDDTLVDRMIRRPTEEDFEDVLTPEGNHDVAGGDVSDSVMASDASVLGTR
jgi:hypothetical protein